MAAQCDKIIVNMVDQLFGSKTRVKLVRFFLDNQGQEFYVRELTRLLDEQINSIRRELINLHDAGVVSSREEDNKVYYSLNKDNKLTQGLAIMFGFGAPTASSVVNTPANPAAQRVTKSSAPNTSGSSSRHSGSSKKKPVSIKINDAKLKLIKDSLEDLPVVIYTSAMGSLVSDNSAPLDLLVSIKTESSENEISEINKTVAEIEKKLNRQVRYVAIPEDEYAYRLKINDRFVHSIINSPQEVLIDRR